MPANSFSRSVLKNIATLGFIGYLPYAPGTWGSLAGFLFVVGVGPPGPVHLSLIIAGTIIGIVASGTAEEMIGEKDSGHIVVDELIGFLVSVAFLPHTLLHLTAGFLLFRFFDILKPFPVRTLERALGGGAGIMADDLAAGILTNVILQAWTRIF